MAASSILEPKPEEYENKTLVVDVYAKLGFDHQESENNPNRYL